MHEEFTSISGNVCNGLFSIGEDGFHTRGMTCFCKLFGRCQDPEREFYPIRDYLCTTNAKYRLARSVRKQLSFVVHMDAYHPVWFTESV
ncbi:hypothetical protein Bca101_074743 [Brassica carinata]